MNKKHGFQKSINVAFIFLETFFNYFKYTKRGEWNLIGNVFALCLRAYESAINHTQLF
jgi:hypothetical protein